MGKVQRGCGEAKGDLREMAREERVCVILCDTEGKRSVKGGKGY